MIPESELRIGNYIELFGKVVAVTTDNIKECSSAGEPIYMTPPTWDICEDFTDVAQDHIAVFNKDGKQLLLVFKTGGKVYLNSTELIEKPYTLHQLQNLFRDLSGQEMRVNYCFGDFKDYDEGDDDDPDDYVPSGVGSGSGIAKNLIMN